MSEFKAFQPASCDISFIPKAATTIPMKTARARNSILIRETRYKGDALICVLADGQGGQFGGGVAAHLAVQKCLELAVACAPEELMERAKWREIIQSADATVENHPDAGFTTLIGLCVTPSRICGASCGDSAALLIEAQSFIELTARQRKNPPIGSGAATPLTFEAALLSDSPLLLMSDGVWKFVGFDRIAATSRAHQGVDLITQLRGLQLSGNRGKLPDDFSVIAVW